ncbi:MAG TPA: hypothetical protein P5089_03930 [Candidatus Portnoybacteria bacterium]|nr:hypothetical protein [Candidatus Portnoybacteria bacterium]
MINSGLFFNSAFSQQHFALIVLVVLLANLIVGGVMLPYQQNQRAQAIWSSLAVQIPQWITEVLDYVWSGIQEAYTGAQAAISAATALWEKGNTILKEAAKIAWNILRKQLLNMIVNDIVKWIQNGTTPRFVTDWQGFLTKAADTAAGNFISQYLGMGFLCDTFDFKLKIALSKPQEFNESAIKCTLSKITSNINNFFNNFSNGGWAGWIEVSETQNNIMGATLMVLDQKYDVMAKAQEAAKNEVSSAAGFEGDKVCSQRQCVDPMVGETYKETYSGSSLGWTKEQMSSSCTCLKWEIRTPGRVAGDALSQAAGVDIENLIQSKEFAEYAAAIIDAVINRVIKEGVAAMKTGAGSSGASGPGITTATPPIVNISPYTNASNAGAEIKALNAQQELLKENLKNVITDYQASVSILDSIKNAQNNTLDSLKDIVQNNCTVPSGVTITQIPNTQSTSTTCVITNNYRACPCTDTLTEKIKFTIPGTGEGLFLKTTNLQYNTITEFNVCELNQTIIKYEKISSSVAIENEIASVNKKISELQDTITKVDIAIKDSLDYKKTAENYMALYEEWQNSGGLNNNISTSTAETAMNTAKTKAIASNQALLSSSSTDFSDFTQETTTKSGRTATDRQEIMTRKGFIQDCAYAQSGSYYKDLCNAQTVELTYKNARNSCMGVDF